MLDEDCFSLEYALEDAELKQAKRHLFIRAKGLPKVIFRRIEASRFDKEDLLRMLKLAVGREKRLWKWSNDPVDSATELADE